MVRVQTVVAFYSRLRQSAMASSGSPLLIFPSTSDADSLCALKIILHVLESDSVLYSCFPVSSYQDIHNYAGPDLCSSENPITILLINWGCSRDLRKILNLSPLARVFVVDSHRPIHLHNLSDQNEGVFVLHTSEDERQADIAALANAGDLNSDDDEFYSESEEESVKMFGMLKKKYYHLGTFHGKPSGCLMYDLSHSLRRNTDELLWLSCVSLTDQFVHDRLNCEKYQAAVMELEQLIIINSGPSSNRIVFEDEPRLMLLREWNLLESMKYSSYFATKLKTWSDKGTDRVKYLLAEMGFALVDCQQKFQFMNVEVKKRMKAQFEQLLPKYGFTDFNYLSFFRIHGYSSRVSAADVVYGVTALLESDGSCAAKKFWEAYDALSLNHLDKLKYGMQKAIWVQRAIVRQGSRAVITKSDCIRRKRKFRWVKLEDSVDAKLLGYPQALTRLCYFVMDALKEKGARMKPQLVYTCMTQDPKKMIVVGVCGKPRLGEVKRNTFGIAFKTAAQKISSDFFQEMFESSWIILDAAEIKKFIGMLTHEF